MEYLVLGTNTSYAIANGDCNGCGVNCNQKVCGEDCNILGCRTNCIANTCGSLCPSRGVEP